MEIRKLANLYFEKKRETLIFQRFSYLYICNTNQILIVA